MPFHYSQDPRDVQHHKPTRVAAPDLPFVDLSSSPDAQHHATDTICIDDGDNYDEDGMEQVAAVSGLAHGQHSRPVAARSHVAQNDPVQAAQDEVELDKLNTEIKSIGAQIAELQSLQASLQSEKALIFDRVKFRNTAISSATHSGKPSAPPRGVVDYTRSDFPWSAQLKKVLKDVWKLESFRSCQEAAINASLDGREVLAVLPTGGGKSLIYQLPAVLTQKGVTIVITPLVSLMDDQVFNLRQKGIAAEQLHSATTQTESKAITRRMLGDSYKPPRGKAKAMQLDDEEDEEDLRPPKLVYVTPERIDKSKTFVNTLQKMYDAGLLARFVIDEAHCISTLGHDYRTSYLALKRLKVLFPTVPITGTTATAPQSVVQDVLRILALPRATSPGEAVPGTTVLFTAPLYRPNLRYQILPKPQAPVAQLKAIFDYIQSEHSNDIGIIYCLTRSDCENVTKGLNDLSKNVRAAVYHAQLEDAQKLRVYDGWRKRSIKVVVATQASFGLGIDNPNVRFVIHHTIAKSMSNYYQESGRAGRDGAIAHCVVFWRAADAARVSTMIYESYYSGGKQNLHEMVRFAEDLETCRKIAFARSFASAYASSSAFLGGQNDESGGPCGHCDNCLRSSDEFEAVDVSLSAYRALRIIAAAGQQNATLTLPQACDLVRGLGKGAFATQERKGKGKGSIDVAKVAGDKVVSLDKDGVEALLMRLLLDGYLEESFHATAYNTISYLSVSNRALRFTRIDPDTVEKHGVPVTLMMTMRKGPVSKLKSGTKRKAPGSTSCPRQTKATSKARKLMTETIELDDDDSGGDGNQGTGIDEGGFVREPASDDDFDAGEGEVECDEDDDDWTVRPTIKDDDGWQVWK